MFLAVGRSSFGGMSPARRRASTPSRRQWLRVGYVLAMIPPNMLLGVALSFAADADLSLLRATLPAALYGLSVIDDQVWGGLIMWIPGSMMYVIAALGAAGAACWSGAEQAGARCGGRIRRRP